MEMQITQEYLGHSNFLVFLAAMWKEVLEFDTFAKGPGSTVAYFLSTATSRSASSTCFSVKNRRPISATS